MIGTRTAHGTSWLTYGSTFNFFGASQHYVMIGFRVRKRLRLCPARHG